MLVSLGRCMLVSLGQRMLASLEHCMIGVSLELVVDKAS